MNDQTVTVISAQNADSNVKPFNINRGLSCASPRRLHPPSQSSGQHCSSRIVYQMRTANDEPRSVLEKSNYKLYYISSTVTDRTVRNDNPHTVILHTSIKEPHFIDTAIPNSHSLHSAITQKLHKYTDLTEDLTIIWQLKTTYVTPPVLSTVGTIPNKLYRSLKQLNLLPAVCIVLQKALTFRHRASSI